MPKSDIDRIALLQKKVDDLETVHLDGKKAHHLELDKLKQNLAAANKSSLEHADRLEKQKKQNTLLESRLQDLKKTSTSDQSDLKDLRHKVRLLELDREKLQPEVAALKKSLATLDTKRKDELKDRDRRIADLEKLLQSEKKQRESLESKSQDETKTNALLHQAKSSLRQVEMDAANREQTLLEQLEQHRCLLNTVAQQYGALAAQSIPSASHHSLQRDHRTLQLRQLRLERKLANSEAQVVELAHLIRQTKLENTHLDELLSAARENISFLASLDYTTPSEDFSVPENEHRMQLAETDALTNALTSTYYRLTTNNIAFAASVLLKECNNTQLLADQRASDLSTAVASHEAITVTFESTKTELEDKLNSSTSTCIDLRSSLTILESKMAQAQAEMDKSAAQHSAALKKEKDALSRLSSTVQKNRMAEDALRAEIEQLTTELTEAERFQEAYYRLSDEVGALITRNQIAEQESDRISKFNAEILGHNNPAQRIMYVDRIRRELAEARHTIAFLNREQENVLAQMDDLQLELDMYTSVRIPLDSKTRTNITRITRPPLVNTPDGD